MRPCVTILNRAAPSAFLIRQVHGGRRDARCYRSRVFSTTLRPAYLALEFAFSASYCWTAQPEKYNDMPLENIPDTDWTYHLVAFDAEGNERTDDPGGRMNVQ